MSLVPKQRLAFIAWAAGVFLLLFPWFIPYVLVFGVGYLAHIYQKPDDSVDERTRIVIEGVLGFFKGQGWKLRSKLDDADWKIDRIVYTGTDGKTEEWEQLPPPDSRMLEFKENLHIWYIYNKIAYEIIIHGPRGSSFITTYNWPPVKGDSLPLLTSGIKQFTKATTISGEDVSFLVKPLAGPNGDFYDSFGIQYITLVKDLKKATRSDSIKFYFGENDEFVVMDTYCAYPDDYANIYLYFPKSSLMVVPKEEEDEELQSAKAQLE